MPNHVHLILVPSDETGLSRAVGETHRCCSGYINAQFRVTGHLFQPVHRSAPSSQIGRLKRSQQCNDFSER